MEVQQAPPEVRSRLKVRVSLVNTPVTVNDSRGQMIHDLEAKDFSVTDNGVTQKITNFDLGGEPLSLVILIETSSRIDADFSRSSQDREFVHADRAGAKRRGRHCGIQ